MLCDVYMDVARCVVRCVTVSEMGVASQEKFWTQRMRRRCVTCANCCYVARDVSRPLTCAGMQRVTRDA